MSPLPLSDRSQAIESVREELAHISQEALFAPGASSTREAREIQGNDSSDSDRTRLASTPSTDLTDDLLRVTIKGRDQEASF